MFDKSAELYDLIYAQFKDYAVEVQQIHHLITDHMPAARTILDIGCGTGEHALHLAAQFGYHVDGIDIEPGFVEIARGKHPGGQFAVADMKGFNLDKRYDVLLCLFSSIGYMDGLESLHEAMASFKAHLKPDGILIIEPWFAPGYLTDKKVFLHSSETEDLSVSRMSYTELKDTTSILHFEYLLGNAEGITSFSEKHQLTLFTKAQMMDSFIATGFEVTHQEGGPSGRGIYVGQATK
ncbi:MAG: class I SAM-dependent methyltransferase [Bacteroidota bacterium]